jgi:hypothetical protein
VSGFDRQFALDLVRRETIRQLGYLRAPEPESLFCEATDEDGGRADRLAVRFRYRGHELLDVIDLRTSVADVMEKVAKPAARALFSAPSSDAPRSAVEVIARRVAAAQGHDPDAVVLAGAPLYGPRGTIVVSGQMSRPIWQLFAEDVRAVLGAIREPTGPMRDAGAATYGVSAPAIGSLPLSVIDGQPSKAWRAMVDAALKE